MGNQVCPVCGENIGGSYISNEDGEFCHPHCYHIKHPPILAKTIRSVIYGGSDPVIARQILNDYFENQAPESLCDAIVEIYNLRIIRQWRLHCEK